MRNFRRLAALSALALLAGLVATGPASAASTGSFTALTYNIAGLPEGLSSAPTPRKPATTAIGQRLGPYDLVNVQEDFNYHAYLYAADAHPYRTPTSGGAGFGSGLNTLSNAPYSGLQRVKWSQCWIVEADCLTPKGFTFARVQLADGANLDLYNLHADAGDTSGDRAARNSNFAQLTDVIRANSAGNAVLVMGDTNTRYTTSGEPIASFAADNDLTDAWVQLIRGGTAPQPGTPALTCDEANPTTSCEVVDKVLYRSSATVHLTATQYTNDHTRFLDDSGLMLSDHDPISTHFTWTTS